MTTIYHNPRCSKSRQALQLLRERNIEPEVIDYQKSPPSAQRLEQILTQLGFADPRQMMRRKEAEYREHDLDSPEHTRSALIAKMAEIPRLIERPIVVHQGKAVIGRPPEKVLEVL